MQPQGRDQEFGHFQTERDDLETSLENKYQKQ